LKIGIIADVHANVFGLEACLKAMQAQGAQAVICAGDIVGYYPFVNETIELLSQVNAISIAGNHDQYLLGGLPADEKLCRASGVDWTRQAISDSNYEYLAALPAQLRLEFNGVTIGVFHGSPWNIEEYIYPDNQDFDRFTEVPASVVVLGHTHHPMIRRVEGGPVVVNPGSCGQPRDLIPLASYALLDADAGQVSIFRVPYETSKVVEMTRQAGFPEANVAILSRVDEAKMATLSSPQMIIQI
jgi:putative phosphoesterase